MTEWRKVASFADGVIYAHGNKRKIVTPGKKDVYYDIRTRGVWWYRLASEGSPNRQRK